MDKQNPTEWAKTAAERAIAEFDDAAAIDTANFDLCCVMMESLKVVLQRPDLLKEVGQRMQRLAGLGQAV